MNEFENIAKEFQGMGLMIKTELDRTRKNIADLQVDESVKNDMRDQIKTIEDSIANPGGGFDKILQAISKLNNDTNTK